MEACRADVAFDGERVLTGGVLVLVRDGVIAGVEPASAAVPDGCSVTYLPGTALLPGLIDGRPDHPSGPDRRRRASERLEDSATCGHVAVLRAWPGVFARIVPAWRIE